MCDVLFGVKVLLDWYNIYQRAASESSWLLTCSYLGISSLMPGK